LLATPLLAKKKGYLAGNKVALVQDAAGSSGMGDGPTAFFNAAFGSSFHRISFNDDAGRPEHVNRLRNFIQAAISNGGPDACHFYSGSLGRWRGYSARGRLVRICSHDPLVVYSSSRRDPASTGAYFYVSPRMLTWRLDVNGDERISVVRRSRSIEISFRRPQTLAVYARK
jgi:hypothetical protein